VVASVDRAPIPVKGSDGLYHVVYEILLINATPVNVTIAGLDILDAKSGAQVASLGAADLALRLVVKDHKASPGVLGAAQTGLLYLHLTFDNTSAIPAVVAHRFSGQAGGKRHVSGNRRANGLPGAYRTAAESSAQRQPLHCR